MTKVTKPNDILYKVKSSGLTAASVTAHIVMTFPRDFP